MNIGIYQAYWGQIGGGQRYVGAVASVLAKHHRVEIVHHCADLDAPRLAESMELDLSGVCFRYVPRRERPAWSSANPFTRYRQEREWCSDISRGYDLFIDNSDNVPFFCHAARGVLITHFPLVQFEEFHGHRGEEWHRRSWIKRSLTKCYHRLEWRGRFANYDLTLTCSAYGRQWLRNYWKREAVVVYPPVRNSFVKRPKLPLILGIGAFVHGQHKKHGILIEAFKRLYDSGLRDWQLVLVGAMKPTPQNSAYVESLQTQADGYPVSLRTNVSAAELRELLEQASIFWHAMGYDVDPFADPARLEHFGMVATEAMAAGCVPIVFNGGGLPESVTHGQTGFLWRTLEELGEHTLKAARDEKLRERLATAAKRRARDFFSEEKFTLNLLSALAPVLNDRRAV